MTLQPVAEVESILYHFLAFGFYYPDEANLERIKTVWPIVKLAAQELSRERSIPCPDPQIFEDTLDEATRVPLDDVQLEYTRLFIKGYPRTPARAVESVYREGVLVGEAAEQVALCYQRLGLESHDEFVDSIASEAEFLAYVSGEEPTTEENRLEREKMRQSFLQRHFLKWAPKFARDVERHAELRFYAALAGYLAWLCKVESAQGSPRVA